MNEKKNHGNDRIKHVKHIFDLNQKLIQMADTKIGILLAINAIIISLSATSFLNEYGMYSKVIMIIAIISSAVSSLMFFLTLFPRLSEYVHGTVIFYKGILEYPQEKYVSRMKEIANDELLEDYSSTVYRLAQIQKEKYFCLKLGLIFLFLAMLLIALSFVLENIGVI